MVERLFGRCLAQKKKKESRGRNLAAGGGGLVPTGVAHRCSGQYMCIGRALPCTPVPVSSGPRTATGTVLERVARVWPTAEERKSKQCQRHRENGRRAHSSRARPMSTARPLSSEPTAKGSEHGSGLRARNPMPRPACCDCTMSQNSPKGHRGPCPNVVPHTRGSKRLDKKKSFLRAAGSG